MPVRHDGPITTPGTRSELRLEPGTWTTRSELPKRGLTITEYPFVVGRKPLRGEHAPRSHVALMFPDAKPYNLSRNHFAIEKGHTALMIRDVGSHLGTVVNGARIGIDEPLNAVTLHIGENEIMAGGTDSPFQFILEITS